jgi:peptidoglycan/xylan/chitin deacetylase (PgdA/CDA1 family)
MRERDVFPHQVLLLPKPGPDGVKLAVRMGLRIRPEHHWEVVLYAGPDALDGIPNDLWFDDEIIWHRQQFGVPGQVASASVFVDGTTMYAAALQSDVVQRISRRRHLKTRVEKRFHGWDRLLLNALVAVAAEKGMAALCVPTATTAMANIDRSRTVEPELFERVYDRHVQERFDARVEGRWWRIGIAENRDRVVTVPLRAEPIALGDTVCVCHDIERGVGHRDVEPEFAVDADRTAGAHFRQMLAVERARGVRATYNVVGSLWTEVSDAIRSDGHAVGFHSFDHETWSRDGRRAELRRRLRLDRAARQRAVTQLARCRGLDGQVRGYRPPRSRLGPDTDETKLGWFSFEWLASSHRSLGFATPRLEHGVVKLPILRDDFALHLGTDYDAWESDVLAVAGAAAPVAVVSLHDCYGDRWLPQYDELLGRLAGLGEIRTLDDVANDVIRVSAF